MLALLVFLFCWSNAILIFGLATAIVIHFASLVVLLLRFPGGILALRTSRLATFIARRWARVRVEEESLKLLRSLDPLARRVYAVEPHGAKTIGMALTLGAPGTESTPAALANNCVVVAHWILFLVPFVAQLFVLSGVVCSRPNYFLYRALDRGLSFAVCPSGLEGKLAALTRPTDDPTHHRIIHVVPRYHRLGFCSLATRMKAKLVPVLSLQENTAVSNWLFGLLAFTPKHAEMLVRVGTPIDTAGYNHEIKEDMQMLAAKYYEALKELARPDYHVLLE